MSGRLQGKRALITGTSSGIGRAAARLFAAKGVQLTFCDRQATENQKLADEIVSGGGIAQAIQTDVGDLDAMQVTLACAVESHGSIGRINALFTQIQQPMTAVASPGNCVIPPRIRPLWSQRR